MVAPYVALTSFVLGHIWRYRTDQFGWTTRSSQMYESWLLRMGSPLFHFGLLGVFGGHVVGLLIPESWTSAVGISERVYHLMAVTMGSLAGFAVPGRTRNSAVPAHRGTCGSPGATRSRQADVHATGGCAGDRDAQHLDQRVHHLQLSRDGVPVVPQPVVGAPGGRADGRVRRWTFQVHALIVVALLGIWPYTRLVHMFSAPAGYLTRPFYLVYRSRDPLKVVGQPLCQSLGSARSPARA